MLYLQKQPSCVFHSYNVETYMTFGEWLRRHRKQLGLTQPETAERAHVSTSYVSTIERGQPHSITGGVIRPEPEKVIALAKAVEGDPDEALQLCGYADSKEEGTTYILDEAAKVKLLNRFLTPEEQAEIADEIALAYQIIVARRQKAKEAREQQAGE
jgi:transcriptional regulator with XRE-family HTH domain